MKIIEIKEHENGAHRNQTVNDHVTPPDGWAVIPDTLDTPNFPFGDVTVNDSVPPVVQTWTPLPIPMPDPDSESTPSEKREEAYNTNKIIEYDGEMITVTEASQLWQYYASEGNTEKMEQITNLIASAKNKIRQEFPDA